MRGVEVLTRSRLPVAGTSAAIDAAVRTAIGDALSLYAVDEARLGALAPDVVITQDLCEVCAVSIDDVRAAVARLAHRDVRVVCLHPTRLADVLDDVVRVAEALGRGDRGARVRAELAARLDAITARAAREPPRRVATVEWLAPIMLGGTWMPELIERAGGIAVGAAAGGAAPTVTPAQLGALEPEVVLLKPCGFDLARTLAEPAAIAAALAECPAGARVYATDGNAYFNRPGPRLVESLEILAACVHPAAFTDLAARHAGAIRRLC